MDQLFYEYVMYRKMTGREDNPLIEALQARKERDDWLKLPISLRTKIPTKAEITDILDQTVSDTTAKVVTDFHRWMDFQVEMGLNRLRDSPELRTLYDSLGVKSW